jgi:hypothetical protein
MIDQQEQQRVTEAAEQFTDALVQSYKTVAERGVSAQESSTQITEASSTRPSITCAPRLKRTGRLPSS